MRPDTRMLPSEKAVLFGGDGLDFFEFVLLDYLCDHTDAASGIAGGPKGRLDKKWIADALRQRTRGRAGVKQKSAKDVKNVVESLAKRGLLEVLSTDRHFIVRRPFWVRECVACSSVQNEVRPSLDPSLDASVPEKPKNNKALGMFSKLGKTPNGGEVRPYLNNKNNNTRVREGKFSMDLEWEPDGAMLDYGFRKLGIVGDKRESLPFDALLGTFVMSRVGLSSEYSHAAWTEYFIRDCATFVRDPSSRAKLTGESAFAGSVGAGSSPVVNENSGEIRVPKGERELLKFLKEHGLGDGPAGFNLDQLHHWTVKKMKQRIQH